MLQTEDILHQVETMDTLEWQICSNGHKGFKSNGYNGIFRLRVEVVLIFPLFVICSLLKIKIFKGNILIYFII